MLKFDTKFTYVQILFFWWFLNILTVEQRQIQSLLHTNIVWTECMNVCNILLSPDTKSIAISTEQMLPSRN